MEGPVLQRYRLVEALQQLIGQKFGEDPQNWREWFAAKQK
jgi:hypothetical protein